MLQNKPVYRHSLYTTVLQLVKLFAFFYKVEYFEKVESYKNPTEEVTLSF